MLPSKARMRLEVRGCGPQLAAVGGSMGLGLSTCANEMMLVVIQALFPDEGGVFLELCYHSGLNLCTLPIPHRILHKYV